MKKITHIFNGVLSPELPLDLVRGNTGRHIFSLWYVDEDGEPLEPFDLRDDTFAMHVRKYAKDGAILIEIPVEAFSTKQSSQAASWEEDNVDVLGRHDVLKVLIPDTLTSVETGKHYYDIRFKKDGQTYTYIFGPYRIKYNSTRNES